MTHGLARYLTAVAVCASVTWGLSYPSAAETVEDIDRALERALTRESGLVLPRGVYEVEFGLSYGYRGSDDLGFIEVDDELQIAQQVIKQDRLEGLIAIRAGLPAGMDAEIRLPVALLQDEIATPAASSRERSRGSGLGDVGVGLTKQLATDRPGRPGDKATPFL